MLLKGAAEWCCRVSSRGARRKGRRQRRNRRKVTFTAGGVFCCSCSLGLWNVLSLGRLNHLRQGFCCLSTRRGGRLRGFGILRFLELRHCLHTAQKVVYRYVTTASYHAARIMIQGTIMPLDHLSPISPFLLDALSFSGLCGHVRCSFMPEVAYYSHRVLWTSLASNLFRTPNPLIPHA